jgi:hypothetical protein
MGQSDIIHLVAVALSAIGIIGTVLWRTGRLAWKLGSLETTVKGLRSWLHDIKAGDSPVCARHDQSLEDHGRRIGRLERLENGEATNPTIIPIRPATDER